MINFIQGNGDWFLVGPAIVVGIGILMLLCVFVMLVWTVVKGQSK